MFIGCSCVVRYQEHTALGSFYDAHDAARMGYQGRSPWLVSAVEVQRVLDSCDQTTTIGRRNYAILLLLPDWSPGARSLDSNASRFNGLDFSSEVGPKSFHQLAHPSDEVGSLHGFEQLRGKVVGLKMKDAIPTPAERLDIRRRQSASTLGSTSFRCRKP